MTKILTCAAGRGTLTDPRGPALQHTAANGGKFFSPVTRSPGLGDAAMNAGSIQALQGDHMSSWANIYLGTEFTRVAAEQEAAARAAGNSAEALQEVAGFLIGYLEGYGNGLLERERHTGPEGLPQA